MTYDNHPYAEVWPSLGGAEFDRMLEDIRQNGQRLPIILFDGKLLDGRNRYRICLKLGIEPTFETYSGTDDQAKALVRSLNEHRRHLTNAQKHDSAAKLHAENPTMSARQIAGMAGVSHPTVSAAIAAANQESPTGKSFQSDKTKKVIARDGRTVTVTSSEQRAARDAEIAQLRSQGCTLDQVSRRMKLSRSTVYDAIQRNKSPVKKAKPSSLRPTFERRMLNSVPALTREQVDPEFTGTPMEFVDKYGHVQMQTAEERAKSRFTDWAIVMGYLAKKFREQPKLPDIDDNWLRSARQGDVERMQAALDTLRPAIQRAEELLAKISNQEEAT